ncbi:MAG: hypothetical protein Q9194_002333 [Teloschistes cf. exilis]
MEDDPQKSGKGATTDSDDIRYGKMWSNAISEWPYFRPQHWWGVPRVSVLLLCWDHATEMKSEIKRLASLLELSFADVTYGYLRIFQWSPWTCRTSTTTFPGSADFTKAFREALKALLESPLGMFTIEELVKAIRAKSIHQKRVDPEPNDEHKVTLQFHFTAKPSHEQLEMLARELNDVMEPDTLGVTAAQWKGMAPVEKPSTAPVEKAGTAKGEESQRLIDF